jgi:hypothetical protein
MARTRQAGNPSFSFSFDGTPSSDTVNGYQCFQSIKKKWELQTFTSQQVENQGQFIQLSEIPVHGQQFIDPKLATGQVLTSPILSDLDMNNDLVLITVSNKDDRGKHSSHATKVCKTYDEQGSGNPSRNLKIKSVNGGERKENEFLGPVPYVSKAVRKICADFGDSCRQKFNRRFEVLWASEGKVPRNFLRSIVMYKSTYQHSDFNVSLFSMAIKHRGKEDCIHGVLKI